jgi:hypothetical protein
VRRVSFSHHALALQHRRIQRAGAVARRELLSHRQHRVERRAAAADDRALRLPRRLRPRVRVRHREQDGVLGDARQGAQFAPLAQLGLERASLAGGLRGDRDHVPAAEATHDLLSSVSRRGLSRVSVGYKLVVVGLRYRLRVLVEPAMPAVRDSVKAAPCHVSIDGLIASLAVPPRATCAAPARHGQEAQERGAERGGGSGAEAGACRC